MRKYRVCVETVVKRYIDVEAESKTAAQAKAETDAFWQPLDCTDKTEGWSAAWATAVEESDQPKKAEAGASD